MKTYKAFNKDLKCSGFQYEIGKEYEHEGDIKICQSGFHGCENPLDVLNYYDLCDSRFAEVEQSGETDKHDNDSKVVSSKIEIKKELDLKGFIDASIKFLFQKSKTSKNIDASSGDCSRLASSGDCSRLASSGDYSRLASSGDYSRLASSGDLSQLASSGDCSRLASSGDYSRLASSGNSSRLASSGNSSRLASSGNSSRLASSGNFSQLASNGENSVIANIGINGIAKGIKGNWITLAEYGEDYKPICVKSAKIDGKILKENIWYKLENKKFTEVK